MRFFVPFRLRGSVKVAEEENHLINHYQKESESDCDRECDGVVQCSAVVLMALIVLLVLSTYNVFLVVLVIVDNIRTP